MVSSGGRGSAGHDSDLCFRVYSSQVGQQSGEDRLVPGVGEPVVPADEDASEVCHSARQGTGLPSQAGPETTMFGYPRRTMAGLVCIYYGNTGSTWLIRLLGASPQVLVPGFEPIEGWAWDAPAGERVDWLRTALMPSANRDGDAYDVWVTALQASPQVMEVPNSKPNFEHVGFKMNGLAVLFTRGVADVLQETKAKAIILTRENRIKHALSVYCYHEEKKSQFGGAGVKPPSRVRLRAFHRWVKESQRFHTDLLRVRESLVDILGSDQVAFLSYEEFTAEEGKRRTLDRLCGFLGVEPIKLVEGPFTKATSDDLRSAVVNYYLLRLRYSLTPLRHFLEG